MKVFASVPKSQNLREYIMIDIVKTRLVLNRIALAKDPLSLMREIVLESGGTWIDTAFVNMAFCLK